MIGFVINMFAAGINATWGMYIYDNGGDPTFAFIWASVSAFIGFAFLIMELFE